MARAEEHGEPREPVGIQPGGGLVEEQELGVAHGRASQGDALSPTPRKPRGANVRDRPEAHPIDRVVGLGPGAPAQGRGHREVGADRELAEQAGGVTGPPEGRPREFALADRVVSRDEDAPGGRPVERRGEPEERRLPAPVRAHDGDGLAARDVEAEVVEDNAAVPLRDALEPEHEAGSAGRAPKGCRDGAKRRIPGNRYLGGTPRGSVDRPKPEVQALLLDAISDLGIAVLVGQGERFVYANEAAAAVAGTSPEDLVSGRSFFDMVAPSERARLQERLRQRLAGALATYDEMEVTLTDGRRVILEIAVKLLPGEPGSFVALYRDVTARKAEETRLRHAEKLAAVGKLLAGVAHDINTPLAVALSNLDVSREELARALSGEGRLDPHQLSSLLARLDVNRAHLRRIATSIRRVQGLRSPQSLKRVPTDLGPSFLTALTIARLSAHDRCRIEADLPTLPLVACDAEVVMHAVQNLLANAVEAARSAVWLRVKAQGGFLEVVVEDDGPGFPAEDLERAFDPFFTTKPTGNMGLGLTLARSIAQDHAGSLVAANRPEGGARMTFRIPTVIL